MLADQPHLKSDLVTKGLAAKPAKVGPAKVSP
jgi:hypothetical protein